MNATLPWIGVRVNTFLNVLVPRISFALKRALTWRKGVKWEFPLLEVTKKGNQCGRGKTRRRITPVEMVRVSKWSWLPSAFSYWEDYIFTGRHSVLKLTEAAPLLMFLYIWLGILPELKECDHSKARNRSDSYFLCVTRARCLCIDNGQWWQLPRLSTDATR